jgi:hypothetical protein
MFIASISRVYGRYIQPANEVYEPTNSMGYFGSIQTFLGGATNVDGVRNMEGFNHEHMGKQTGVGFHH